MSNLRLNTYAAAVLASGLAVIGVDQLSAAVFDQKAPDKPGYLIEITTNQTGAANSPDADNQIDLMAALVTADIAAGQKVAKKCVSCHSFEQGGKLAQGPPLWGVVGRDIATYNGFAYSQALIELPGDWDEEALFGYLRSPKTYARGTAMNFIGLKKSKDRVNIIAYLTSLDR